MSKKYDLARIIGKSLFYASIQFSIGSVMMSSTFSVGNFAKDQETLDSACLALKNYLVIGLIWSIGTALVMYASYDRTGVVFALISNFGIMLWIYLLYIKSFKDASSKNNLKMPKVF